MVGYERVLLIDAVFTGKQPPGNVYLWSIDDLTDRGLGHLNSTHDMTLQTALAVGRALGLPLPKEIFVFGVEAEYIYNFSEKLTPPVLAAMPTLVRKVLEFLYPSHQEEIQA
jgi:hydrogenase maturation protease